MCVCLSAQVMFWRRQQKHGRARHVARQLEVFVVPLKPTDERVQSKRRQDGRQAGEGGGGRWWEVEGGGGGGGVGAPTLRIAVH